jgi:RecA-family ATPase
VPGKDKNYAGWFPRGHVSLIGGSSGMGKTTAMIYLLEDLRNGRPLGSHPAATADYRILIVDRTVEALEESLEFKGLDETEVLKRAASVSHEDGDPAKVLRRQLRRWKDETGTQPDLIFLEGIDFWVRKNNDLDAVFRFVKTLEPVAQAWNVAILASIGSPKIKAKDNYVLTRDKVLGTSAWGRTTHTILFVERLEASDSRKIAILTRTGRDEHIYFRFEDGRAIFSEVEPAEAGLADLNVQTDQQKAIARRQAELDEMRKAIEPLPAGT